MIAFIISALVVLLANRYGHWLDIKGGEQDGFLDYLFGEEGFTIVALMAVIINAMLK